MSRVLVTIECCSNCFSEIGEPTRLAELQRPFEELIVSSPENVRSILDKMNVKMCCRNNLINPQYFNLVQTPPLFAANKDIIAPCVIPVITLERELAFPDI